MPSTQQLRRARAIALRASDSLALALEERADLSAYRAANAAADLRRAAALSADPADAATAATADALAALADLDSLADGVDLDAALDALPGDLVARSIRHGETLGQASSLIYFANLASAVAAKLRAAADQVA